MKTKGREMRGVVEEKAGWRGGVERGEEWRGREEKGEEKIVTDKKLRTMF